LKFLEDIGQGIAGIGDVAGVSALATFATSVRAGINIAGGISVETGLFRGAAGGFIFIRTHKFLLKTRIEAYYR
jgi:hypothetical protein